MTVKLTKGCASTSPLSGQHKSSDSTTVDYCRHWCVNTDLWSMHEYYIHTKIILLQMLFDQRIFNVLMTIKFWANTIIYSHHTVT